MSTRSSCVLTAICLMLAIVIGLGPVRGNEPDDAKPPSKGPAAKPDDQSIEDMGTALLAALRDSPGCLGVESATTESGQEAIFAWFESKKAVLTWYESPMHQSLAGRFFSERDGQYRPLARVPDDGGPIMVIAALRFAEQPQVSGVTLPISQISIELYQPLPAGLSINGAFTPERVPVPGRRDAKVERPRKVQSAAPAARPADASR